MPGVPGSGVARRAAARPGCSRSRAYRRVRGPLTFQPRRFQLSRTRLDLPAAAATPAIPSFARLNERVADYAARSKSKATIKAYATDWRDFLSFCEQHAATPLAASDETVAAYLAALPDRGAKAATIARRLVLISQAHKAADLPSPTTSSPVRRVHGGVRRSLGTAQAAQAPALVSDLKQMLQALPGTRVGLRDRAVLLLGF
ncbi:MAG: site-specific integrase, partial [Chloroflexi bacterium]|nr:site-specific integrase [Chloroflexota bacterium]